MRSFRTFSMAVCLVFVAAGSQLLVAQEPTQAPTEQATADQGKTALDANMKDILFPFDSSEISNMDAVQQNAQWLRDHPNVNFVIAAFTDPQGDIPYNLLLSGQRADAVKKALVENGVDPNRIEFATGWGKLYQNCDQQTEDCFQANRRAKIIGLKEIVAVSAEN